MKPYSIIEPEVETIIREMQKKCQELHLGNCSFNLFDRGRNAFAMTELEGYWELKCITEDNTRFVDIYKMTSDELIFQSSKIGYIYLY
ncbi:hypothetical protein [Alkalibaculum bacchi]|mgnify:CR=1 FL=1|jgi:hypothetical protein|uniref:hypothetical protein n=1 Tax=Alkalibaculum bacchi TaxID=645887 RepID=UPI0026EC5511|nr:hypothetical protein [Alkalibaculum bacchi]